MSRTVHWGSTISVRICPLEDGTVKYWAADGEGDLVEITPVRAFEFLREGAWGTLALDAPGDPHSHYEADQFKLFRV